LNRKRLAECAECGDGGLWHGFALSKAFKRSARVSPQQYQLQATG
jgi:hypothetical protein